jgi:outer membrane receptor protein involved in Fe transport
MTHPTLGFRARATRTRALRLAPALWLIAATAAAQTNRGGIAGTVFDPLGAVVPGATVVVTNVGTSKEVRATTSGSGTFSVAPLDPVTYRVTVTATGFQAFVVERVKVDTATVATVDVHLKPAGVAEETTVVAEAPVLNAQSGTPGQTITERQIVGMPLNNRSVLDLAMTTGNVAGMAGTEDPELNVGSADIPAPGFNMFVNGGRAGSTSILADGARNTGVGIGRALVTFSPDTVQEFTVQTSNFSAEYGQTGGGVINMTTKSGTNQLNGLAYWYHRNPALNAAPFTTATVNRPTSNRLQHQGGLTLGGPVVLPKQLFGGYDGHNRTFFFVAYEPRYYYDEAPTEGLLPTEAMRRGDLSNLVAVNGGFTTEDVARRFGLAFTPLTIYNQFEVVGTQLRRRPLQPGQSFPAFPNNQIPANLLDPTSQQVLQHLALPGEYFIGADGNLKNYAGSTFIRDFEQRLTLRLDHQLTQGNRLSARYTQVPIRGDRGSGDFQAGRDEVNSRGTDYSWSKQFLLQDTHAFSSSVINDFGFNYTYGRFTRNFPPQYDAFTGASWTRELGLPSITPGGVSEFITGMGTVGWSQSDQNENTERTFNFTDNVTWVRGDMSWKAGLDLAQMELNTTPMFGAAGGRYEFNANVTNSALANANGGAPFASFLLGVYNTVSLRDSLITYNYQWRSAAAFIQNDWHLRPGLTLNLGLRYTLQLPRTEQNDLQGAYLPELAKEYPLPAPVTLPNGKVITSALVPPFAYSGRGGRSRYLTPIDWNGWEPRFGFAWVPGFDWNSSGRLVVRGGYGLSHLPLTGLGRNPAPDYGATQAFTFQTLQEDPAFTGRLCCNPPGLQQKTPEELLQIPANGLVERNSLAVRGASAIAPNSRVPYIQSWSASFAYELPGRTALELSYLGSKGSHLFYQPLDINPIPFDVSEAYRLAGLDINTNVPDPLGRVDASGRVLQYPRGYLGTQYLGFAGLRSALDASANSLRHAVSVNLRRQQSRGLSYTLNYTYGKGFDNASQAGSVRFVDFNASLSPGHVNYGAPPSEDWSVSTFDIKHAFSASFLWDLPVGRDRRFLSSAGGFLDAALGGWSLSGVGRVQGGPPLAVVLLDGNGLSSGNARTIRPDLVPGVPLLNPLYSRDCPVGAQCEPYFNPAAFMRPVRGDLGNAPRTLDQARWPSWQTLDLSLSKDFLLGQSRKRRLQFRVDAINVLNHPIFRFNRDSDAGNIFGYPSEAILTDAEFNAWAAFNNQPALGTPAGNALKARSDQIITSSRIPGTQALPRNFFSVPVPEGFHSANPNAFDVTTPEGLKLYRLRQQYATDRWGTLAARSPYSPRFIQFAIKLYF